MIKSNNDPSKQVMKLLFVLPGCWCFEGGVHSHRHYVLRIARHHREDGHGEAKPLQGWLSGEGEKV